jgi:hypothetical protein
MALHKVGPAAGPQHPNPHVQCTQETCTQLPPSITSFHSTTQHGAAQSQDTGAPCAWVAALEVINQLSQVLNGVDVVVWWGADQAHAWCAVTRDCNVTGHLLPGQFPTLSGLGTLQCTVTTH